MKKFAMAVVALGFVYAGAMASAATTKAHWKFDGGVSGENVINTGNGDGVYSADILDVSGNENHLSVWATGGGAGYAYRSDTASPSSSSSVKNTGGDPGMWCNTMNTWSPTAFTIEAVVRLENGGWRSIVGRDSLGANTLPNGDVGPNGDTSALYLQVNDRNGYSFKFCDASGVWHQINTENVRQGYNFVSGDESGDRLVPWTALAAVSDGSQMYLYMNILGSGNGYELIGQADIQNTTNPALSTGAGDGGDWDAGTFTVGRGLFEGEHRDRGYGYFDEVRISDGALTAGEFLYGSSVQQPKPVVQVADLANQDVDVTLTWDNAVVTGAAIAEQYVFVGEVNSSDPNIYCMGMLTAPGAAATSSFQTDLDYDTLYKWSVVGLRTGSTDSFVPGVSTLAELTDPNAVCSAFATFQSLYSVPVITTQPIGGVVKSGESFSMSIVAESITTATYTWFRSLDQSNTTFDDDVQVGVNSDNLALTNVQAADQGYYYCKVTNTSNSAVYSSVALLEVEGLIAHYSFSENLNDSVTGYHGEPVNESTVFGYVDGYNAAFGKALNLNGSPEAVEVGRSIQNSMTIEMWVKTSVEATDGGGWYNGFGLIDAELPGDQHDFGTALVGKVFAFGVGRTGGGATTIKGTTNIVDGNWHYLVATRNHITGDIALYVDGEREATAVAPTGTKDAPSRIVIGSLQTNERYFVGAIDEIKLSNYAITELQVAENYYQVTGSTDICVQSLRPDAKFDLVPDCEVNILDLAEMAAQWLDCGLYPGCF
ncbi:MAG: immunoglobulin domain-containing protein [Sedimentisphaerales bacterium]|nr:immunoglobulin domain-containing protein [Sedimentisphaerales bacterium]